MKNLSARLLAPLVVLWMAAGPALAQSPLLVRDAWVRGTTAQQRATGAFMQLQSTQDLRIVAAASPVAGITEIHEMKMDNGIMKMRALSALEVPAGQTVDLRPGGYHVMLVDLKKPLSEGDAVPITLTLETADGKRSTLDVSAVVRPLATRAGGGHAGHERR